MYEKERRMVEHMPTHIQPQNASRHKACCHATHTTQPHGPHTHAQCSLQNKAGMDGETDSREENIPSSTILLLLPPPSSILSSSFLLRIGMLRRE